MVVLCSQQLQFWLTLSHVWPVSDEKGAPWQPPLTPTKSKALPFRSLAALDNEPTMTSNLNFNPGFGTFPIYSVTTILSRCVLTPHSSLISHSIHSPIDAFEEAGDANGVQTEEKVHVRVQQRSGRKCITTVAGLADDLDIKRICKAFKKNFSCNGAVQKDEDLGEVIQLSGDQRTNVKSFLVDQEICLADSVVLHGF